MNRTEERALRQRIERLERDLVETRIQRDGWREIAERLGKLADRPEQAPRGAPCPTCGCGFGRACAECGCHAH